MQSRVGAIPLEHNLKHFNYRIFDYILFVKVGKEFDETTADGRDVTALVTVEDNKFIYIIC